MQIEKRFSNVHTSVNFFYSLRFIECMVYTIFKVFKLPKLSFVMGIICYDLAVCLLAFN